jgi:hypothetical protein
MQMGFLKISLRTKTFQLSKKVIGINIPIERKRLSDYIIG